MKKAQQNLLTKNSTVLYVDKERVIVRTTDQGSTVELTPIDENGPVGYGIEFQILHDEDKTYGEVLHFLGLDRFLNEGVVSL